jgi:hypothetical protein
VENGEGIIMGYNKLAAIGKSKNDAERLLNETMFDNLPKKIQKLILDFRYKGTLYGRLFREAYPKSFEKWYNEEFLSHDTTTIQQTATKH